MTVLCIRFEDADRYATHLFIFEGYRAGCRILQESTEPDAAALKKACAGRPVLISVSGYGIVTKPTENTAIVEKVTSDPETFAWSLSSRENMDKRTESSSFVGRAQVGESLRERRADRRHPLRCRDGRP